MANDELKVGAVLNQIDGLDHQGTTTVGVPAIFGMNFQAPNIGQKFSGYADASGTTPQTITTLGAPAGNPPGLAQAIDYVDGAIGRMLNRLDANGLTEDTMVIMTAKHANSPVDRSSLRWVDPGAVHLAHRHQRAVGPDRAGHRGHHGADLAEGSEPSR